MRWKKALINANHCSLPSKGEGGDGPGIYFPPEAGAGEYIFLERQGV